MHVFVGWILVSDFPVMRRRRRWRDEEELVNLWRLEMYVRGGELGVSAKVDADSTVHNDFAVKGLLNECRRWDVVERHNYASKRLERAPGMYRHMLVYCVSDCL